ncbi:MAG: SPOR domain-containing protein [Alistipes sp.]|nr:SPOR domain-containing protein [Alistipes sp.]
MKKIITLIALSLFVAASAQNLSSFKQRLASPIKVDSLTTINATVQVTEHNDAAHIIATTPPKQQGGVNGYRIMLFMSNSQNARAEAFAACDSLAVRLPGQQTYVTYDNPYFKVFTGNCTTQEEALVLLEQIKPTFPKAFIMRNNIPLSELSK